MIAETISMAPASFMAVGFVCVVVSRYLAEVMR